MTVDGQTLVSLDAEDFQQRTTKYGEFLRDIFETMCSDVPAYGHSLGTARTCSPIQEMDTQTCLLQGQSNSSAILESCCLPTAAEQKTRYEDNTRLQHDTLWSKQHPEKWNSEDVMAVMKYICNIQKIPQERHTFILQQFANIDGNELVKMQKHEFREKVPMEGDMIFHVLKTMFNIN